MSVCNFFILVDFGAETIKTKFSSKHYRVDWIQNSLKHKLLKRDRYGILKICVFPKSLNRNQIAEKFVQKHSLVDLSLLK